TCLLLGKLALEAGIPAGVVNMVTGYGAEAGAALPAHPLVRHMSFTGSPGTGSPGMAACAKNLIPIPPPLGRQAPPVLLPPAGPPAGAAHELHRLAGHRLPGDGGVCQDPHSDPPRAGRQVSAGRAARR